MLSNERFSWTMNTMCLIFFDRIEGTIGPLTGRSMLAAEMYPVGNTEEGERPPAQPAIANVSNPTIVRRMKGEVFIAKPPLSSQSRNRPRRSRPVPTALRQKSPRRTQRFFTLGLHARRRSYAWVQRHAGGASRGPPRFGGLCTGPRETTDVGVAPSSWVGDRRRERLRGGAPEAERELWSAVKIRPIVTALAAAVLAGCSTAASQMAAPTGGGGATPTVVPAAHAFVSTTAVGRYRGRFRLYPIAAQGSTNIATGPDAAIWFSESAAIARLDVFNNVSTYALPRGLSGPQGLVTGPDGALWFVSSSGGEVGRLSTWGQISGYRIPTPDAQPANIANGPDGNLWFTELGGHRIGRITTGGLITEF